MAVGYEFRLHPEAGWVSPARWLAVTLGAQYSLRIECVYEHGEVGVAHGDALPVQLKGKWRS